MSQDELESKTIESAQSESKISVLDPEQRIFNYFEEEACEDIREYYEDYKNRKQIPYGDRPKQVYDNLIQRDLVTLYDVVVYYIRTRIFDYDGEFTPENTTDLLNFIGIKPNESIQSKVLAFGNMPGYGAMNAILMEFSEYKQYMKRKYYKPLPLMTE